MLIEVKAVSDNAESDPIYLDISWNGEWSDDTKTMKQNLVVKESSRQSDNMSLKLSAR